MPKLIVDWDVEGNHYVQLIGAKGEDLGEVTMPDLLEAWTKHTTKGKKYTV